MRGIRAARALRMRERRARIMLGFDRRHSGACIFVQLQMRFGPLDGRLCSGEILRSSSGRPGGTRRLDRLARITHFLDRRAFAGDQAGKEREYDNIA